MYSHGLVRFSERCEGNNRVRFDNKREALPK